MAPIDTPLAIQQDKLYVVPCIDTIVPCGGIAHMCIWNLGDSSSRSNDNVDAG